jgi:hypothetical protein
LNFVAVLRGAKVWPAAEDKSWCRFHIMPLFSRETPLFVTTLTQRSIAFSPLVTLIARNYSINCRICDKGRKFSLNLLKTEGAEVVRIIYFQAMTTLDDGPSFDD